MTLENTALILEKTFRQALASCHKRNKIYYDLFVAVDYTEGRFTISDEDDNILAEEILFDYAQGGEKEALGVENNTRELKKNTPKYCRATLRRKSLRRLFWRASIHCLSC